MTRRIFFDESLPNSPHKVRVDGVVLVFGSDGTLADPTAEQVEVMTADPYLRQRFVERALPRSPQTQGKAAEKPAGGSTPPPAGEISTNEAKDKPEPQPVKPDDKAKSE